MDLAPIDPLSLIQLHFHLENVKFKGMKKIDI
jgi:hypothetical protein